MSNYTLALVTGVIVFLCLLCDDLYNSHALQQCRVLNGEYVEQITNLANDAKLASIHVHSAEDRANAAERIAAKHGGAIMAESVPVNCKKAIQWGISQSKSLG